jgi:hypothetical protein
MANSDTGKILMIRGNHEDASIYARSGEREANFRDEIIEKMYRNQPSTDAPDLLKRFALFFESIPCALVLSVPTAGSDRCRLWMSHGGFPMDLSIDRLQIQEASDRSLYRGARVTSDQKIKIMWSDFTHNEDLNGLSNRRGAGNFIAPNGLGDFLSNNKIDFVIRGHQDNESNSYLLSQPPLLQVKDIDASSAPLLQVKDIDASSASKNIHMNEDKATDRSDLVYGPIAKIVIKGFSRSGESMISKSSKNDLPFLGISPAQSTYPVLTLSTCNDRGRTLVRDSFSVLEFDNMD